MKLSKLIEILAQYLQAYGDIEILYSDSKHTVLEDITEMDLNIESWGNDKKRLILTTILEEKRQSLADIKWEAVKGGTPLKPFKE